jgi:hypothetical protein
MIWAGSGKLGSALLGTAPLTTNQQIICWVIGASSLLVNIAAKKIPLQYFSSFASKADIESGKNYEFINKVNEIKGRVGTLTNSQEN